MRVFILLLLSILFAGNNTIFAQLRSKSDPDFKKKFDAAIDLMLDENYVDAIPFLLELDAKDPMNANINFKIGLCYLNSLTNKGDAIPYLQNAILSVGESFDEFDDRERNAPLEAYFLLGQANHYMYNFDEAIEYFDFYKGKLEGKSDEEKQILMDVDKYIDMCLNGKDITSRPVNLEKTNLKEVNSSYDEYSPSITADEQTLIFTSRREGSTGDRLAEDGKYYEDIFISQKTEGTWGEPLSIGSNINTIEHDASISLSVDGQTLFLYKDDEGDGNIYMSKLIGATWSVPEKLGASVNSKYFEPSASLSADGRTLYFSSNRKGGFGGLDIYKVNKLPNGEWALAQNLGSTVNTPYDEDAPYIHPDGVTLFFSSKGHKTMGGYDIFVSYMDEEGLWIDPFNIGYPINTTGDDVFYVPSADGKRAYFSSFNTEGLGGQDIYMIKLPEAKEVPLTLMKGTFKNKVGEVPDDATITVTDNVSGELEGIFRPNSRTGKYLFILEPGKDYNITYEAGGYLFKSDNLKVPIGSSYKEINNVIALSPIEVGEKITLNNLFYDFDAYNLRTESQTELEKLYNLMVNNTNIIVEIASHTDSKGEEKYNMKLSQNRSQSVVDFLIKKNIASERLIAKGYGESKPVADNESDEGMQLNRRTELIILKVN